MRTLWVLATWLQVHPPYRSSCLFSGPCWALPGHGVGVSSPEGRGRTDISMLPELGDYLLPMSGLGSHPSSLASLPLR